ncbi:TPM domain-containing protein [Mucilaginibacter polytrichastri]|uniref:TPM domain-containing protein n=1 Tax=Mucilaginibacter polytrichastri TaxID=1302689 RepID=A0A1Q5ZZ15_9SPHI|nr:TPM domain-containing protein [Mucilaginibacter polytrichastri]OKS86989.1 hypothetical protein RG47T_2447 [Mucilaginibacter polytrichastri]SFS85526.1 uncharacterized protein SAMN04487890_10556 [Mucilaginibacter polytrichastri]
MSTPKAFLPFSLFFYLLFFFSTGYAQQVYQSVDDVPNPKISGQQRYISDAANVLESAAVDSLNQIIGGLEKQTGVEAAVVIVNDFNTDIDDFTFAKDLFRKWGIGKKYANNGLLLFISTNRHHYRFITGYGLEGLLPDAALKEIGDHNLVPYFKEQQYGAGILLTLKTISAYLKQPANSKELKSLLKDTNNGLNLDWLLPAIVSLLIFVYYKFAADGLKKMNPKLPKSAGKSYNSYGFWGGIIVIGMCVVGLASIVIFVLYNLNDGFKHMIAVLLPLLPYWLYVFLSFAILARYLFVLSALRKAHQDDLNFNTQVEALHQSVRWYIVLSPLLLVRMKIEKGVIQKTSKRFANAPADALGNNMTRVDRDKNKTGSPYLSEGQKKEEKIGVYQYDIWVSNAGNDVKVIPNEGPNFQGYEPCPKCGFKTLGKPKEIEVVKPTRKREGKGKEVRECAFCDYESLIAETVIPVLIATVSSRSRDDDDNDSSSSGSSSESGSWGGGSTGGGGAGGTW